MTIRSRLARVEIIGVIFGVDKATTVFWGKKGCILREAKYFPDPLLRAL